MSFYRSFFVAAAALFAVVTTSALAADYPVPAAPVGYAQGACGGCTTAYAPILYGTPVAPSPIYVGGACGSCGFGAAPAHEAYESWGCGGCGVPTVYTPPAPIYVVNQGPAYTGPGLMVPFHTYAPPAEYAPPPAYPPYYGYRYYPRLHQPY